MTLWEKNNLSPYNLSNILTVTWLLVGTGQLVVVVVVVSIIFRRRCSPSVYEVYSCRSVALCGSVLFAMGIFLTSFATSIMLVYTTYGLMAGMDRTVIVMLAFDRDKQAAANLACFFGLSLSDKELGELPFWITPLKICGCAYPDTT